MINLDEYVLKTPIMMAADGISRWEVWFQTPWGLYSEFEDAKKLCLANDWLPSLMIIPVPVALDHESNYEVSTRST